MRKPRVRLQPLLLPDRLAAHMAQWRRLTDDEFVLDLVEDGLRLEFKMPPSVRAIGPVFRGSPRQKLDLLNTLSKWLAEGAIESVDDVKEHCFSLLFPVEQKGKLRWCLDARYLNKHLVTPTVKMYGVKELRNLLPANCWFCTIDLESAYLHVPIRRSDRRWLAFQALGRHFRFCTMIFGLSPAPAAFTRLMRPVLAALHRVGICCLIYLDDLIIWSPVSYLRCQVDTNRVRALLRRLGLKIKEEKCQLRPSQVAKYLGLLWDSRRQRVSLTHDRLAEIRKCARKALNLAKRERLTVRQLARMTGKVTAAMPAMQAAFLYRHSMQRCVQFGLRQAQGGLRAWDATVELTPTATDELRWWASRRPHARNGRPWRVTTVDHEMTTDASSTGWGGTLGPDSTRSTGTTSDSPPMQLQEVHDWWSEENARERTSNWKECAAVVLTYFHFRSQIPNGSTLRIRTDNTTALSILRRFGSRKSSLGRTMQPMLIDVVRRNVTLVAEHIRGSDNYLADLLSRKGLTERNDWALHPDVATQLRRHWPLFNPTIDLFATPQTCLHDNYCSLVGESPQSAFSLRWAAHRPWLIPPINLIGRVVGRLLDDRPACAVVVTPLWTKRGWYATLLSIARDRLVLPIHAAQQSEAAPIFRDAAPVRLIAWLI